MRPTVIFAAVFAVILVAGILPSLQQSTGPALTSVDPELEDIIENAVASNDDVKNCVLLVKTGDGSFTWAGAAGVASQDGQVPMTPDTPIYLASITKLYTATAIMCLYERGALGLDDPMADHLPDDLIRGIHVYQGHDYSTEITIAQLLSHTSGIPDYYSEEASDGRTLFETFLEDPDRTWTVDETIARARDEMTPHFEPGTAASYSDTNYQLLGKIIESVTGKPLQAVFDEFFFEPLGLRHTWLVGCSGPQLEPSGAAADVFSKDADVTRIRSNGSYWADGGIVSTVEDAVAFLQALNRGEIVSRDTLELMHHWRKLQNLPFSYGYGTMRLEIPPLINWITKVPPVWGHVGSTGSFLYYSEDLDLYLAGTIDQTENRVAPILMMIDVMRAVAHHGLTTIEPSIGQGVIGSI
jgi:D-alanyl-D-alanine carboxypeptidase